MNITYTTVADFGLAPTAELLTRAFADYFVKIPFTEAGLRQAGQLDSVDFDRSLVVRLDGEPVGAALLARRGLMSRVAGMGFVPEGRRRGLGRLLMERLLADARERGERRMGLEVIAQNIAAGRLYESVGFRKKRRLLGFAGPAPAGLKMEPGLAETSLPEVAGVVARLDDEVDWPWQISGETIARLPPPVLGYALEGAWMAVLNPSGPVISVRTLVSEGSERRTGRAVRLLHAVMARHPASEWRISALWPEELSEWFTQAGLARQELFQWQMVREF